MNNSSSPSHESVAQRARQIWLDRGQPAECDSAIWLEAESQLTTPASAENWPSASEGRGNGKSQSSTAPGDPPVARQGEGAAADAAVSGVIPNEAAALADQQKKIARAPQQATKEAPRNKPPETGKPLWKKPHSA